MKNSLEIRTKGFTLIELLVVIAIIGILSSVVLASLSAARMKARDAKRISDLGQIATALELYNDANGAYAPGASTTIQVGFFKTKTTDGTQSATADTDGYDSNAYESSDVPANWSILETQLKPYLSKLPVDSINNGHPGLGADKYSYVYGYVGKTAFTPQYDLYARLETPGHPQSCGKNGGNFPMGFKFYNMCTYGGGSQMYSAH